MEMLNKFQIDKILDISKGAGDTIIDYYNGFKSIDTAIKDDKSMVTKADLDANAFIAKSLKSYFPELDIISEENSEKDNKRAAKSMTSLIIDPLEGSQFIYKKI